jgi:hypothetical protein
MLTCCRPRHQNVKQGRGKRTGFDVARRRCRLNIADSAVAVVELSRKARRHGRDNSEEGADGRDCRVANARWIVMSSNPVQGKRTVRKRGQFPQASRTARESVQRSTVLVGDGRCVRE